MGRPVRRAPGFSILAVFLAAGRAVAAQGVPYAVSIIPEPPRAGEVFTVTVSLPGASAGEVDAGEPDSIADLAFVSLTVSSAVIDTPEGPRAGAKVAYAFRAEYPGELRIPKLEVSVGGLPLPIGPLAVDILPSGNSPTRAPYVWNAPVSVTRWQCFPASLASRFPDTPALLDSALPASPGLSLESAGSLSFVGIALAEGTVLLPAVPSPDGRSASEARQIRSLAAPREIADSRAVGVFTARLIRTGTGPVRAGETLTFRMEVRGTGNLPVLEPPEIRIRGPGNGLVRASAAFPVAEFRLISGAYAGMTGRELRFVPDTPGEYTVETSPFVFLDSGIGEVRTLRPAPIRVPVDPAPPGARPRTKGHPLPEALLATYAGRPGVSGAAASLAREGKIEAALVLLEGRVEPESLHLAGILLMSEGEGIRALAALGAAERRSRWLPGLAESLALCEEAFGVGPRVRDRFPQPRILGSVSIVLLTCSLVLLGFARIRARSRVVGRRFAAQAGWTLLAAAGLAFLLSAASALERRTGFGVVAVAQAWSVPSETATRAESFLGRSGVLATITPDWALLRFPDGRSAWFRSGDYLRY